ncbi:bacteriophage Gp15 family protein [Senegalia massiliensis]|uniref:Bacteriophage Gp15 protein n=1 Tax=Senegalia massiliensis TaxID=1720316 RepID=A0A845R252_9CLOT|nr:bacteriophage Gp15 family protein [Senegalia massiliensis]NBI08059.1 hypothetical protein [Senegalia massiliensis]
MNILIDLVPDTVEIDGIDYKINTCFRISMMFELLMQDNSIPEDEKLKMALNLYYEEVPDNLNKAVEKILWFYKCGKEDDISNSNNTENANNNSKKADNIYSFGHDDEYIYSAFLDQYGIDLQDIEHLHWWKFKAMFKSLKDDNLISKIMGYRSITISSDMSDNDKKYYRKMKEIYALPDNRTQEEKENDFDNVLSSIF